MSRFPSQDLRKIEITPRKRVSTMATARYIAHPHRHNSDGSVDSICLTCFQTIARAGDEAALTEHERKHSCDREVLAYREADRLKMKAHSVLQSISPQRFVRSLFA